MSARTDDSDQDVSELRKRLDMAEDELTFLKAVFEEYKDSSGELEAELDAQLKDLERSNLALKRENEQIRAQLQSTVTRSRKSAEEASNLTTALETHLEELTKREKKAQSRIRILEQENEQLVTEKETLKNAAPVAAPASPAPADGDAPPPAPAVGRSAMADIEVEGMKAELLRLRDELGENRFKKNILENGIANVKEAVFDARVKMSKLAILSQLRLSTDDIKVIPPAMAMEGLNTFDSIQFDLDDMLENLTRTEAFLNESQITRKLVEMTGNMLADSGMAAEQKIGGEGEQAINMSCMVLLGKIMRLALSLPQFKNKVTKLKDSIGEIREAGSGYTVMATRILDQCQEVITTIFTPMDSQEDKIKEKELELEKQKNEALKAMEIARVEGAEKARKEAQEQLKKMQSSSNIELEKTQEQYEEAKKEMARLKAETENMLQSARTEAKQMAEQARKEALKEASTNRKSLEEEIYASVAEEMDKLRAKLEDSEAQYKTATMKQTMYANSMKSAIGEQAQGMKAAMVRAREQMVELQRETQIELAETQKIMNTQLDHVRKVARTIAKSDVATLSMMYERELDMRVKLQDQVQQLKGNIRVFCRIRPLLGNELENGEHEAVSMKDNMTVQCEDPDTGKLHDFNFDRVFNPEANQEVVFDELRTLCLSAMDGYNVCLFAYGITGSGKTYTVEGGGGVGEVRGADDKLAGLVYRTLRELFKIAKGERGGAYETKIGVQLLELYNEEYRDLLVKPEDRTKANKIEIRISPEAGVTVDNVTIEQATSGNQALGIVMTGYKNRTVRGTDSNAVSSRSHSILTLHIDSTNLRTKKLYSGKLHFIDLAGSERVGKSGVQGEALKEAQAINKSLAALGDVISALSAKEKFIPFRNSMLTKLLQESLGGNSKTVMISNIAPCSHSLSETIASLRFATRVHKVEMGKASKKENEDQKEVKDIKNKMADLESKFNSRGGKGGKGKAGMKVPASPRGRKGGSPRARGSSSSK